MRSSEVVVRRNNLPSPGKRHLAALDALFIEVLMLCRESGMVKMGRVALDGTKVRANASRHKAMSYERMCQSEARLAAEAAEMMHQAERVDAEEDAVHGADNRGGDLRGEMARRESRLAKIRSEERRVGKECRSR